jgi:hypothetical protein
MESFNINAVHDRVRKIIRIQKVKKLWDSDVLVPLTAHVGSFITVFSAWFMRTGSFEFRVSSWTDWFIAFVLILVTYSGIRLIIDKLGIHDRFLVKRGELSDLNTEVMFEAESSVAIIGGDLSWLQEGYKAISYLKESKPELKIRIYHDRLRFSQEIKTLVNKLHELGTEFSPYPKSLSHPFIGMLIDGETPDVRLYTYTRSRLPKTGEPRSEHPFLWQKFDGESRPFLLAVSAFLSAVDVNNFHFIRVGICGSNNVGKTRLAMKLKDILSKHLTVKLYLDEWRMKGGGSDLEYNYTVLIAQLLNEMNAKGDVTVFDRTSIDALCFLRLKSRPNDYLFESISPDIAKVASQFDVLLDVHKSSEDYSKNTTYTSGEERKFIRETLDSFFSRYGIEPYKVVLETGRFDESIENTAREIAQEILKTVRERKVALHV